MLLSDLVTISGRIAATAARNEKVGLLAAGLRRLEPREIPAGVAFLSGHLRQGRIGLGWASIEAASSAAPASPTLFDQNPAARQPPLGLSDVDQAFERIATLSGSGSLTERTRLLAALLRRAIADERDFLVRLILGELRQGALVGIMEEAIASATGIPAPEIRRAVMLAGDLDAVARAALAEGRAGLVEFRLQLFRPIQPMLAQPAEDLGDALERLGEAALEYKLDGARIQVHKSGSEIRVFSRRQNDVTVAIPEIVAAVRSLPARDLVLDGEALALRADGTPHPFQVTMRRFGRRLDVEQTRRELPVTPFFFDLLRLDGEDLLDRQARERFLALRETAGGLAVPQAIAADLEAAEAFLDQALERGHEGLMAKATEAPYQAGSRGSWWLKVKPAHALDLVVLAAEWGHGRRAGWLSNLHLGAPDPAGGGFVMLGKTFKGMTDEMLAWQTKRFEALAVATEGPTVHLRPELVVEVAFGDVQESPQYPGGMALRFARVKRYREDKTAEEADTVEAVRKIMLGRVRRGRGTGV